MILFLGILGFLLLVTSAMLVILHRLEIFEESERKELQKLVSETVDQITRKDIA
jgi:hypothetical protein